uniref:NADH-ubiquinone oxidoreductase chain 4 n=1 Tax=Spirobranchus giganteus TaxID=1914524 RepID=A0A1I9WKB6_9ANNE|nr:NADH dehydrogenase subunit 4 [Spirobranchus giganteus]APA32611.1 NADH dehydrogenase subunit 4 [Spirobranchus giganteus]
MILMTVVLSILSLACLGPIAKIKQYYSCVLLVCLFSSLAFYVDGGMLFFLFFEGTFFPISYMVIIWGHNYERVVAVTYMVLYSVTGSIYHMLALAVMNVEVGSGSFSEIVFLSGASDWEECWWWGMVFMLFLIKSPLFIFHLWLSKAHVEAPTAASILLAGILLKLGVFGMLGYSSYWWCPVSWGVVLQVLGILGSIYAGLVCLRSQNIKLTIAQSSIAHMSLCVAGFFCGSQEVFDFTCLMAIAHGFCASGMFLWAGGYYGRGSSLNSLMTGGQRLVCFEACVVMALLLFCNCSTPPFISFWVELTFFSSLYGIWWKLLWVLIISSFTCMAFNVVLGVVVFHGEVEPSVAKHDSFSVKETLSGLLLVCVLVVGYFS